MKLCASWFARPRIFADIPILYALVCLGLVHAREPDKQLSEMWDGSNRAVMPLLSAEETPRIDGVIGEGEWERSVGFAGFVRYGEERLLVTDRPGFVNMATDGSHLYLSVRTATPNNDPGGGLATRVTQRDGSVCNDDSVEVALVSDASQERGFHIIVNSAGVVFDRLVHYKPERYDLSWNCAGLEVGSTTRSGWWELELKIPFASIGAPEKQIKINVARNWQGLGPSALVPTQSHTDHARMIALSWDKRAAAVQMRELGAVGEGLWHLDFRVSSVQPNQEIVLAALLRSHVWKQESGKIVHYPTTRILEERSFNVAGSLTSNYATSERDMHSLNVLAREKATGRVLYARTFFARKGAETGIIPPSVEADLAECGSVQCFHYPGYNRATVVVLPSDTLRVERIEARIGREKRVAERSGKKFIARLSVPEADGEYGVGVTIVTADGRKRVFDNACTLTRKSFPWQNKRHGTAKVILPPFKPLTRERDTLDMTLRRYTINSSGVLDSLVALDRELLDTPMHYELVCNGRTNRLAGAAPSIKIVEKGYAARISSKVKSPDGITLLTDGRLEYDGFLWNSVRLERVAGRKVERLTLVAPLKEREFPLLHAVTANEIRRNPSMALPSGEGLVWSGDTLPRPVYFGAPLIHPQFVPYLWLGAERRGFSWFMDSSFGLRLDNTAPAVRVVRRKGVLRLEIDLINRPCVLKNGHSFAYGLQATPVKPQDKRMRRWFQCSYPEGVAGMTHVYEVDGKTCGYTSWSRFPHQRDYRCLEAVSRLLHTGDGVAALDKAAAKWEADYFSDLRGMFAEFQDPDKLPGRTYFDWWCSVRDNYLMLLRRVDRPMFPMKYSDPTLTSYLDETTKYFQSEWVSQPTGYTGALRAYLVPSYMDYILEGYHQEIKRGIVGVYLDDMFLICCRNPDTEAKIDEEGFMHVETGLLRMRELVKRLAVMQHEAGQNPRWLQIHMTNATLVPAFSFATSLLCWEDKYGEDEFQDRFAVDALRTGDLGTQLGAESVALDGISRRTFDQKEWQSSRFEFLTRTQMAVGLPHGIKFWRRVSAPFSGIHAPTLYKVFSILADFRVWSDECEFVPCFESDNAVAGVPDSVLAASYRRAGETLIVLGNLGETAELTLHLDRKVLQLGARTTLYNAETGVEIKDGRMTLPRRDFAILRTVTPE